MALRLEADGTSWRFGYGGGGGGHLGDGWRRLGFVSLPDGVLVQL